MVGLLYHRLGIIGLGLRMPQECDKFDFDACFLAILFFGLSVTLFDGRDCANDFAFTGLNFEIQPYV